MNIPCTWLTVCDGYNKQKVGIIVAYAGDESFIIQDEEGRFHIVSMRKVRAIPKE